MSHQVKVLKTGVSLPDGSVRFVVGDIITLSDAQFALISSAAFSSLALEDLGGTPDGGGSIDVRSYGVVGDGRRAEDGAIAAGTTSLSSASAGFSSADVGKQIKVKGAGASGAVLTTTIASVSAGVATLAVAASTTVSAAMISWGTDDTAALSAAMTAAKITSFRRGGTVLIPRGCRCLVSSPIPLFSAVSIVGEVWSDDSRYYLSSMILASASFSGSAILKQDPDGQTVPSPSGPDYSWHQGVIERISIVGNGTTGPHGIDLGWNGEASTVRNVMISRCASAIYLTSVQASCQLETVSLFSNQYGLNCDNINGTVRAFGISGDNNTSLVRVKGGISANVSLFGMKAENYVSGTGDPVIDIVDLDGGMVTIVGGWCDASAAKSAVIKLSKTGATTNYPRLTVIGLGANTTYYTNMVNDTIAGKTAPVLLGNLSRGTFTWNMNEIWGGQGGPAIAYGARLYGQDSGGNLSALVTQASDDKAKFNATYAGGELTNGNVEPIVGWGGGANKTLGFYGGTPVAKQTGVAVTAAGVHAALVALGLISP